MSENKLDLKELLNYIDPAQLDYQEWAEVGMALKHEGYEPYVWDEWSRRDPARYHDGETYKKWESFNNTGITGATITMLAKQGGWEPRSNRKNHHALDWNSTISEELVVVDHDWLENKTVQEPNENTWSPVDQIIEYLNILFEPNDYVSYVFDWHEGHDGRPKPNRGVYQKTADNIIKELTKWRKSYDDLDAIGYAMGDYDPEVGAWVRFNPLDGQGIYDDNVTDYRYALIESDSQEIEKQYAIYSELELPIKVLVHSGNKSLHAIVEINANSPQQYKERVNYIYEVCEQNGLRLDKQNRNASRLSRLPGVERKGNKQFIVDKHIGKESYTEWEEWIEAVNDDLPDPESLADFYHNLPEKSPELIHGMLRQGHKMLLAGPSKAGKSISLIELTIAIAEGMPWLGWPTTQGRVLYVNLELDEASALHRFKDIYDALGWAPNNLDNIDIWNLRGKTAPMDKLAPKLIRRSEKRDYIAVIIDPIYKVLTGDENSAEDMAYFTNQFDKIATELKSAVIYAHHHSKGAQGGKKSMDRSSGSGVFARDPDAIIDLVELELTDGMKNVHQDRLVLDIYAKWFREKNPAYYFEHISRDDMQSIKAMTDHADKGLKEYLNEINGETLNMVERAKLISAWRVEGTLREFAKFEPRNMWFDYPIHTIDDTGLLKNAEPESEVPGWKKATSKNKENKKTRKQQRLEALEEGYEAVAEKGKADIKEVGEAIGIADRTVRNHVKEHPEFEINDGYIVRKED